MAFPTSPSFGDQYPLGGKTFRWGGLYWSAVLLADQAPTLVPSSFQKGAEMLPWIETLVTSYPSAVPGNHIGVLLNYI